MIHKKKSNLKLINNISYMINFIIIYTYNLQLCMNKSIFLFYFEFKKYK